MSNDALGFEKEWGIRVRESTEFLRNWARTILAIDHTQEDTAQMMEHYRRYETAWKAINHAVPKPIVTKGKVTVLMPPSEAEWETDCAQLTILTRWGDLLQDQRDWNAAAATYQRAATETYVRPNRPNNEPSPGWVSLLASWCRLLSVWGGALQQAGDPLHIVSESVRSFRATEDAYSNTIFRKIEEDQIRYPSEGDYAAFRASYQDFESSFKLYNRHWLNCFPIEASEEDRDYGYVFKRQLIEERGEPALAPMYSKLDETYRSVEDGFQQKLPEPSERPAVWRPTSRHLARMEDNAAK